MCDLRSIVAALLILLILSVTLGSAKVAVVANEIGWNEVDNFRRTVKSCEQARAKAELDFGKGNTRMFFNSGFDTDLNAFPYNFYEQLEKDYQVKVILAGDVAVDYLGCYNIAMDSLLSQKVGYRKVERLYKKLHAQKYEK